MDSGRRGLQGEAPSHALRAASLGLCAPPPPTHLGHILWALPYGAKELPGGWEVEISEVVQGVRVGVWELGRGNLLQELPLKVSDHWTRFHQGDAGDIGRGTGVWYPDPLAAPLTSLSSSLSPSFLVPQPTHCPSPGTARPLPIPPFSSFLIPFPHHHCLPTPLLLAASFPLSFPTAVSRSPVTTQTPASQDVELQQLDSQALKESLQGELGGCIDFIEHDT